MDLKADRDGSRDPRPKENIETVAYLGRKFDVVRKRGRRALTVKLHHQGFKIFTNHSTTQTSILRFLEEKKNWLEKNFKLIEEQQKNLPQYDFKDGELFPFLGEMKYLQFVKTEKKRISFSCEEGFLICYLPESLTTRPSNETLCDYLIDFYKKQATSYLIERCWQLGRERGLHPKKVKIQTAQTRWGSCNSLGTINLNWKLMTFAPSLIDYVIVHELCHLKHLNHSVHFWNLVEEHFPQYQEAEAVIKHQSPSAWFLNQ